MFRHLFDSPGMQRWVRILPSESHSAWVGRFRLSPCYFLTLPHPISHSLPPTICHLDCWQDFRTFPGDHRESKSRERGSQKSQAEDLFEQLWNVTKNVFKFITSKTSFIFKLLWEIEIIIEFLTKNSRWYAMIVITNLEGGCNTRPEASVLASEPWNHG